MGVHTDLQAPGCAGELALLPGAHDAATIRAGTFV